MNKRSNINFRSSEEWSGRDRMLHLSCAIIPPQEITDKNGVTHTIPARVSKGTTYRRPTR